jgi:hypothetical protein
MFIPKVIFLFLSSGASQIRRLPNALSPDSGAPGMDTRMPVTVIYFPFIPGFFPWHILVKYLASGLNLLL